MSNFDIIFQDIVITEKELITKGEFNPEADPKNINESSENLVARLNNQIRELASDISNVHKEKNCTENTSTLKEESLNTITRLITSEFYFFTQRPLFIDEFKTLMEEIASFASNEPENFHLILGSFAVLHENKVMNVVPIVECGQYPKMNFIVKNNFSEMDPVYKIYEDEALTVLPHFNKNNILPSPISIEGIGECAFSFKTVSRKETAGGVPFYFCLEICIDHVYGLAKRSFISELISDLKNDSSPQCYSHIVLAHSIQLINKSCLGEVTYADPNVFRLNQACKWGVAQQKTSVNNSYFGTPSNLVIINPSVCGKLPSNLNLSFVKELGDYISLRENECNGMNPKHHSKFRLFNHAFGATAADKINAAIHVFDLLILNRLACSFFGHKEEQFLKKDRLGKIIEKYSEDFESLGSNFLNKYHFDRS